MKEFRSLEDVEEARLPDAVGRAVHGTLKRLVDAYAGCGGRYDPAVDGYAVLIEPEDADDAVRAAIGGSTLRDAPFEGAAYEHGCFVTCVLFNNQFGVSIVIPDAPWLEPSVRERLMADL